LSYRGKPFIGTDHFAWVMRNGKLIRRSFSRFSRKFEPSNRLNGVPGAASSSWALFGTC